MSELVSVLRVEIRREAGGHYIASAKAEIGPGRPGASAPSDPCLTPLRAAEQAVGRCVGAQARRREREQASIT